MSDTAPHQGSHHAPDEQRSDEQLELEALPTMIDLDELESELDDIDRVLVELEGDRPDRRSTGDDRRATPPTPSQSGTPEPAR